MVEARKRALALSPADADVVADVTWALGIPGRFQEMRDAAVRLEEADPRTGAHALAFCLRALGRRDDARSVALGAMKLEHPADDLGSAYVHAVAGEGARAREILKSYDHEWQPMSLYLRASVHMVLGEPEDALHWLEEAVGKGYRSAPNEAPDSDFAPIAAEPRYEALLVRMRAR